MVMMMTKKKKKEKSSLFLVNEEDLWRAVASALSANRVALKECIEDDAFRTPRVRLVLGDHGLVNHVENKIKYSYDVTKCMFSSGNVSEKLRVAQLQCYGEIVVDLYAGIGYFTLPFLVHAKATLVHACEWNPHSIQALERNLQQNGVRDRCVIHFGDNRKMTLSGVAQRVYLGLIPSSEQGWETACKTLNPITGGVLHIHGNVTCGLQKSSTSESNNIDRRKEWMAWAEKVVSRITSILASLYEHKWTVIIDDIVHIKNYAPHIDHVVADVRCSPGADVP